MKARIARSRTIARNAFGTAIPGSMHRHHASGVRFIGEADAADAVLAEQLRRPHHRVVVGAAVAVDHGRAEREVEHQALVVARPSGCVLQAGKTQALIIGRDSFDPVGCLKMLYKCHDRTAQFYDLGQVAESVRSR